MRTRILVWMAIGLGVVGAIGGASAWLLWPQPTGWTEEAHACIADDYAGYWESGGKYSFRLEYHNTCDRKVSCAVSVQVTNAREALRDRGTLLFPARGQTPDKKVYSLPVTSLVGGAQAERSCRFV